MISEGFKASGFGGGPDHKSSKFYPSSRYRTLEIFCMQTCPGVLYKLHMMSLRFCCNDVFCLQKTPKNIKAVVLVFSQKVKQLEFFNWHLDMNLLVQWNTKMHLVLELSSL